MKDESRQAYFVICAPITGGAQWPTLGAREIERQLRRLGNPASGALKTALDATEIIHFFSMSVLHNDDPFKPEHLLLEIAADGNHRSVIGKLVEHAGDWLLPLFSVATGATTNDQLRAHMLRFKILPGASPFFSMWSGGRAIGLPFKGSPRLSVKRIKQDDAIASIAEKTVIEMHGLPTGPELSAIEYRNAARARVLAEIPEVFPSNIEKSRGAWPDKERIRVVSTILTRSSLAWAPLLIVWFGAMALTFYGVISDNVAALNLWQVAFYFWIATILSTLMLLSMVVVVVAVLAARLRWHEQHDRAEDLDPDPDKVRAMMARENQIDPVSGKPMAQNHTIGFSDMKPGFLRKWIALPLALHVIDMMIQTRIFRPGYLSSMGTIHFAQWVLLPGDKLAFLSNYDGSFESYMEDFITKGFTGLNGVWSNTQGFPKTRWLYMDGAQDGDRFKRWARRQQVPSPFWYTAYPLLTASRTRNNADVRDGLAAETVPLSVAEEWLKLFGSAPRPFYTLETHEVQSIVLNGQRHLWDSACLLIEFPEGSRCSDWLKEIITSLSFGDSESTAQAKCLGLTAGGLERLGLKGVRRCHSPDSDFVSGFPAAFTMGMDEEPRSRALGDFGDNAAHRWKWGGPDTPVHAVLLLYSRTDNPIATMCAAELQAIEKFGLRQHAKIDLQTLPKHGQPIREPFGFVDGISQPAIRYTERSARADPMDVVEPGEFILGYKDGRGYYPPTARLPAAKDPGSYLPNSPADRRADDAKDTRDLGRNGSYLAIRQLQQRRKAFDDYANICAQVLSSKAGPKRSADWVKAKMMGRWQDGAPLARYPNEPPPNYSPNRGENDFLYGRDDPQGLGCPFGAHIRRANPRDSFGFDDPDQLAVTNRHRVLRRGRAYVEDGEPRGMMFMCFNADIERQFEFVQQNWIASSIINSMRSESDPIAASGWGDGNFTIPLTSGPERLTGMPTFISVLGGAYFFVPSRRALSYLANLKPVTTAEEHSSQLASVD